MEGLKNETHRVAFERGREMNVRDIIIEYIKANDFDGLSGDDCGCDLNNLCPCDECCIECVPAYKAKPTQDFIDEWGECEFMMSLDRKDRLHKSEK